MVKPGVSMSEIHRMSIQELYESLDEMGALRDVSAAEKDTVKQRAYPHSIGHFLGMDVHDTSSRSGTLKPGMVVTIEPGLYLTELSAIHPRYWEGSILVATYADFLLRAVVLCCLVLLFPCLYGVVMAPCVFCTLLTISSFRNIGIRVEDDVLVTDSGCDVLTSGITSHPDELEALWSEGK